MSLDLGYSYCINLTEQEKLDIDKQVRKNRGELKFAIFFTFLPFPMPSTPFFPVEGFSPQQIVRNAIDRAESAGGLDSANAKDNGFLPGAHGFKPSISIQNQQNQTPEALKSALEIRCGDLGKSGPGPKAKADARNAMNNRSPKGAKSKPGGSVFAEAWLQPPWNRSRPAAANRLAQQLQPGQATPNPSNLGCAAGPRSITDLSRQRNENSSTNLTAYDRFEAKLTDKSENHFTSKHGHRFGVDDPLPPNLNQKPTKYESQQIRTRLTKDNKAKVREEIKSILSNTKSNVFTDVKIRGTQGRVYLCRDTNRVVSIHTEGEFAGQIMKAQPISERQVEKLSKLNILVN